MSFWVLTLDYRRAPLEVRGRLSELRAITAVESKLNQTQESLWLNTCNRIELYGVGGNVEEILDQWVDGATLPKETKSLFRKLEDIEAVSHLFKVTSSLESMVMGETQVTGQVKRAYMEAHEKGRLGSQLHLAFQKAFKVAKQVRSDTAISRLAVSIPSVGVKLAERVMGELRGLKVGIIGCGEIGRVAAEHFATVQPSHLLLYNRTVSVALEVADKLKDPEVKIEVIQQISDLIARCDIVIGAVDAKVVFEQELKEVDQSGVSKMFLDLSVPACMEGHSRDFENIYIFRIDDLKEIAEENVVLRSQELDRALQMIDEAAKKCSSLLVQRLQKSHLSRAEEPLS